MKPRNEKERNIQQIKDCKDLWKRTCHEQPGLWHATKTSKIHQIREVYWLVDVDVSKRLGSCGCGPSTSASFQYPPLVGQRHGRSHWCLVSGHPPKAGTDCWRINTTRCKCPLHLLRLGPCDAFATTVPGPGWEKTKNPWHGENQRVSPTKRGSSSL